MSSLDSPKSKKGDGMLPALDFFDNISDQAKTKDVFFWTEDF